MALKFKYTSREEILPEHLPLYIERDGAWQLDVDGAVDKARLDEFRENNVTLLRERDELRQRFEGINPDEARELAARLKQAEEQHSAHAAELQQAADGRAQLLKATFEQQLSSVTSERDAAQARLASLDFDQRVLNAALRLSLRPTAVADIMARARSTCRLVDNKPAVLEGDGKTVRKSLKADAPMTLEEWVDTQVSEAPHLFAPTLGGGVAEDISGGGAGLHGHRNPFHEDTWNLTEQMRLEKTNPQLAARLKNAARDVNPT